VRELGEIVAQVGHFRSDFLELSEIGWVEKKIDVRKLLSQSVVLIRHHAAGEHDRNIGALSLEANQRVEFAGDLVFGGLAYDARIENDNIGFLFV
jgi:hypothetical protein